MSLATPAEFIRSVRAHDIEPLVFCTHLIHTAARGDGTVSADQTANEFDIHPEGATYLYELAAEFDLVEYQNPTSNRVTVRQSTVTEFIQFLTYFDDFASPSELELLAEDRVHDVELSIAVPESFEDSEADLMARLIRFVRNAEEELLVITPFFTRFGVDTFVDHLAQATSHGVHVTVITRDISDNGDNSEHVQRIRDTVANSGVIGNLTIHEYQSDEGNLHAKALISDRQQAYVGSANFTNYSLQSAIEIGLIVDGPVVDDLREFFATVQASSDSHIVEMQ